MARRKGLTLLMLALLAALCLAGAARATRPARAEALAVRIMPLGDSITSSVDGQYSYRYFLWHLLLDAGYSVDFVGTLTGVYKGEPLDDDFDQNHEGHSGFRAQEILDELDTWLNDIGTPPDVVLIHLGTVDMVMGDSVSLTISELGQIIDMLRLRNSKVKILLAQIIPTTNSEWRQRIILLNAQIPGLAKIKSNHISPVRVVDQYTGFDPVVDTWDGVHPDASGEIKIAARWFAAYNILIKQDTFIFLPFVQR